MEWITIETYKSIKNSNSHSAYSTIVRSQHVCHFLLTQEISVGHKYLHISEHCAQQQTGLIADVCHGSTYVSVHINFKLSMGYTHIYTYQNTVPSNTHSEYSIKASSQYECSFLLTADINYRKSQQTIKKSESHLNQQSRPSILTQISYLRIKVVVQIDIDVKDIVVTVSYVFSAII